ncbi:hypothetical protein CE195_01455 [Sodalis-like symbiont of Philaenus spumarius]|nr:hypothetical protein CE195_01455 [Sodalis-like symbiont of Philaenus spumarius]
MLVLLTTFNIGMITSDNWGSYARTVPEQKHLTGKIFTQRIERRQNVSRLFYKIIASW